MPYCPVNIPWDITGPISPGMHMLLMPPAVPAPVTTIAVEMVTTVMWTAGYALGKNKFAKKVTHKGGYIMQDGHDIGPLIPDITIPFVNVWYVKMWPLSKREVKFSASKVQMEGKATGCASVWPPFVMISCGEPISLPITVSYLAPMNTVQVNLSWADIAAGVLNIIVSVALDYIFDKAFKGWNPSEGIKQITKIIALEYAKEVLTDIPKNLIGGLCGMLITHITGTGTPQFKLPVGNSWVGGELALGGGNGREVHVFGYQWGGGSGEAQSQTGWQWGS